MKAKNIRMKYCVRQFFLLKILLFGLVSVQAQTIELNSTISADTIRIGEQLMYEIELIAPESIRVNWPAFGDTLSANVEILRHEQPTQTASEKEGYSIWKQQLLLTSFDTGLIYIPPFIIEFATEGDTIFYPVQSNPLMLQVLGVAIDVDDSFKPVKAIEEMPITFWEILPWIIGILAIALLLFGVVWWYLHRRNKPVELEPLPQIKIAPHLDAIEKLETLRHQKLWQAGKLKEYYTALSDIVREYIELQFPVNAVELTTPEILQGLQPLAINEQAMQKLAVTLELADLVKFAKAEPTALENDSCLNYLLDFVHESYATVKQQEEGKEEQL